MTTKTILIDPSVEYDDNMFFINYDKDTAWIEDWRGASHMTSIGLAIRDKDEANIPMLIKVLKRVLKGEEDNS